ncbi:SAM-dependent methyltransferase [Actinophytocola sp.]|jgi:SAM-dependent MidA family methyltransferase|uniref:SAM-dependent methyltransferase n=1 Tax=Actinophytocola sp. TaxID=1872138 RepID=UPI002ED778B8
MTQAGADAKWRTWRVAGERALYDATNGFYRTARQPARHFRTSVHASPHFAGALLTVLAEVDAALGHPARLDVVDVGAGGAELLAGFARLAPAELTARLRPVAVEVAPRPTALDPRIAWTSAIPASITGVVIANEWLDNIPVDVAEQTADGPRLTMVDPATGAERAGEPPDEADRRWLDRWWPLRATGARAEIGRPRDEAWAAVLGSLTRGVALAMDYAHEAADRPVFGTLTGYRDGRQVLPVPDGSCDITAHVALDACAAAGVGAGATATVLSDQRTALCSLGVLGRRPPISVARSDPARYLRDLRRAGEDAELIDRAGLGAHGWLVQAVGTGIPAPLRDGMR